MKRFCLAFLLACLCTSAWSQEKTSSFEIMGEVQQYTYREPHMDHPIKISGPMMGASLMYTQHNIGQGGFVSGELRYMEGRTDYDGYLDIPTHPVYKFDDIGDYYVEGRLIYGQNLQLDQVWTLSPYYGLGYRRLRDHGDKDPLGYFRQSEYYYMPLGAYLQVKWDGGYIRFNGEADYLLQGEQYSGRNGGVTNTQREGYGLRGSVRIGFGGSTSVFVEPFYRYWHLQDSDVVSGLVEPHNSTREYGIKAGFTF